MMEGYYNGEKLVQEFSKFGTMQLNSQMGVARIQPHVEQRTEIIVDSSVPADVPLDEIPPHLKHTIELFFVNTAAIYPVKQMIQCVAPGKLQTYTGKVWEHIQYRDEWKAWEEYTTDMEHIQYPFVVLPSADFHPRTWRLMDQGKMELFKTLLTDNHRQITLQEFNAKWAKLFYPDNVGKEEFPISAWLHISETPSAYVDVIEIQPDRSAKIVFTVPPLMSFNQGLSSIMGDKKSITIDTMIMRCRSESAVIPNSGDERLIDTFTSNQAEPEELTNHTKMWLHIFGLYGWSFTGDGNTVNNNVKVNNNVHGDYEDEMDDFIF